MEAVLIVKKPGRIFRDVWLIHERTTKHDYAITLFEEDGKLMSSFSLAQQGGVYEEGTMTRTCWRLLTVVKAREELWEIIRSFPRFEDLEVSHITNIDSENPQEALLAWSETNRIKFVQKPQELN